MKSMPLSQLPWEAQLLFWVLMTLVTVGFGLATWFLIRYVNGQDAVNKENSEKFTKISTKIEDLKSSVATSNNVLFKEVQDIKSAALGVRQQTLEDIAQIKDDVRATKELTKIVETHQTVLKTVVIKLNNLTILKSEKKD